MLAAARCGAIARLDAPDAIEASSAGLAPLGFVVGLTKQTLMRKRIWGGRSGVQEYLARSLGTDRYRYQHEWSPREQAFREYSKVEDWEIDEPLWRRSRTFISKSSRKFGCALQN